MSLFVGIGFSVSAKLLFWFSIAGGAMVRLFLRDFFMARLRLERRCEQSLKNDMTT